MMEWYSTELGDHTSLHSERIITVLPLGLCPAQIYYSTISTTVAFFLQQNAPNFTLEIFPNLISNIVVLMLISTLINFSF